MFAGIPDDDEPDDDGPSTRFKFCQRVTLARTRAVLSEHPTPLCSTLGYPMNDSK
jgi:hypothetical protein